MVLNNSTVDNLCEWLIANCPAYLDRYKEIMEVMYSTGCRVSEAVLRSSWTFTSATTWTLKPNKESWERPFQVSALPQDWKTHFEDVTDIIHQINYRKFQYQINLMTRQFELRSGEKSINSHIFRHNYIRTLSDSGLTPEQVQQQIGHKSLSSTQGYLNAVITSVTLPEFPEPAEKCPLFQILRSGQNITFNYTSNVGATQNHVFVYNSTTNYSFDYLSSPGNGTATFTGNAPNFCKMKVNPIVNGIEMNCPWHTENYS